MTHPVAAPWRYALKRIYSFEKSLESLSFSESLIQLYVFEMSSSASVCNSSQIEILGIHEFEQHYVEVKLYPCRMEILILEKHLKRTLLFAVENINFAQMIIV